MPGTRTIAALAIAFSLAWSGCFLSGSQGHGSTSYDTTFARDGHRVRVAGRGPIELSPDGLDITSLGPGGELRIDRGTWLRRAFLGGSRTLILRTAADGRLEREYRVAGRVQPYEPDGATWMATVLPELLNHGFAARANVERLLKNGGSAAVLEQVARMQSDHQETTSLGLLVDLADLRGAAIAPALAMAGREIESDFELARLLTGTRDRALNDPESLAAYFTAASTISSDFELRRVLSHAVEHETLTSDGLNAILRAGLGIDSDFEMSRLLQQVAAEHDIDQAAAAFFAAADTISSDFEHARVLTAAVNGDLQPGTMNTLLSSATEISSDFELARLLVRAAVTGPLDAEGRQEYIAAASSISSEHERNRALVALQANTPSDPAPAR